MLLKNHFENLRLKVNDATEQDTYSLKYILFAIVVIYFQHAWVQGFFHDGYLYAAFGKNAANLGHWLVPFQSQSQYSRFDQHPPLVFILEGVLFKLFGSNFLIARIFAALWGAGSVLLLFFFLKKLKRDAWGFFAAILLLLFPSFIKKVRFPNMDIPLTLSFIAIYFFYYLAFLQGIRDEKNYLNWFLVGVLWGISLLIKGPTGLVIPLGVTLHLILTGRFLPEIKKMGVWIAITSGLLVFSIWPLMLYLTGQFGIFSNYISGQVLGTIIESRGKTEFDLLFYVVYLFKKTFPWLIILLIGLVQYIKSEKKDFLYLLFWCWFLSLIIPFSFMRWKYSHYILPLYPAYAALAAYSLKSISFSKQQWISYIFKALVIITSLTLLVFPLTTKSKRHPELFQVKELLEKLPMAPINWIVVNNVYDYWSVSSFASYVFDGNPHSRSLKTFEEDLKYGKSSNCASIVFLLKKDYSDLKEKHPLIMQSKFKPLIYFPSNKMMVLLNNSLLDSYFIGK